MSAGDSEAVQALEGQNPTVDGAIQRLDVVTGKRVLGLLEALIDAVPALADLHRPHIELLKEQQRKERQKWLKGT